MILGIPVVDGHSLTGNLLNSLAETIAQPNDLTVVIIDNASILPYEWSAWRDMPFRVEVKRYEENIGYYRPLINLALDYPDDLIGLIHNDMLIYNHGWDIRMKQAFIANPLLGLLGLCGSNEIDQLGGRGSGTMCNFLGRENIQVNGTFYKGQNPQTGRNIRGIQPACVLDSLFMLFNRHVISRLMNDNDKWNDMPLGHFYDRIWPMRVIEAGFHVAVAGEDCDHLGGMTMTGNERYRDDCIKWLDARGIVYDNPETEMYLVAERRFLTEYREQKKMIPCRIGLDYAFSRA